MLPTSNPDRLQTSLGNRTADDYEHHYGHSAGNQPALTTAPAKGGIAGVLIYSPVWRRPGIVLR